MSSLSQALTKAKEVLTATATQFHSLLHHLTATPSLTKTKQLHAHTITSGTHSPYVSSNLAKLYALCSHLQYARKLFDEMPDRKPFLYNALIRMYVKNGLPREAMHVFVQMLASGTCRPDRYTYPAVVKACSDLSVVGAGVVVHGKIVVDGFGLEMFVMNGLLAMYMGFGERDMARRVFDAMQERDVVSWNTMISGYFRNGCTREALSVFGRMMNEGVEPDRATLVSLLPVIGSLKCKVLGRRVHAFVEEMGLGKNLALRNALVDMYIKCGGMNEARVVFENMAERDVVTWTTMINGYILSGEPRGALALCWMMQCDGVKPNSVTIASLLSACGSLRLLEQGKCLHGWTIRQKLESDVIVVTALIDMYSKSNSLNQSFQVFVKTSKKRTVPWNSIISGCIHNSLARDAIELFKQMLVEAVKPNEATLNCLLPAYSILVDLHQTMNIHGYLVRSGFLSCIEVATGLIDAYSKGGSLEYAYKTFNGISEKDRDIVLWSVIIAGYGTHGHGKTALSLFYQMVQSGVRPNEVTFTSVLHACSHAGLVEEGLELFRFMLNDQKLIPNADHYTCIVDLLGRAGRLVEAYDLIRTMSFQPNHAIWGAILGACVIHDNVELGEVAAKWLFELDPENTGNYVLMAKIYAAAGRWKDAENVRYTMNEIGLRKSPAHSLVDVRNN
ncbi:PREDICTED: pentatricopeptide repeat-containing protein At5g39350 [Fragaria vesca subsp. vesca]|uniref:pentatricopeptide repeat-containing protein At5g39350 n=1 Tax=Fragaria vesca subsp. vesca TaxID=101020 RepID=UPI0002C3132B|nr:PREDICTED: pentatricopeptide repeat-containing protein At5g39350 [Fragaria vesca subsp. vesca]